MILYKLCKRFSFKHMLLLLDRLILQGEYWGSYNNMLTCYLNLQSNLSNAVTKGQSEMFISVRCPYKRGHYDDITFMTPVTVLSVQYRGGEETRSGTKKRCSHNLQSGHPAWWSADNCSIFLTVNIFRLFRSKKETGRGIQKCLKNWKNNIMHLCFCCISYLSFGTEIMGETKTQPC